MSENAIITAASVIGAGLVCLGAAMGAGFGNGNMCGKSIESMARQPEESGKIFTNMLVCVGLDSNPCLFCAMVIRYRSGIR